MASAFVRMSEQAPFYLFITFVLAYGTRQLGAHERHRIAGVVIGPSGRVRPGPSPRPGQRRQPPPRGLSTSQHLRRWSMRPNTTNAKTTRSSPTRLSCPE